MEWETTRMSQVIIEESGGTSVNPCLAAYRYRWLYIEIFRYAYIYKLIHTHLFPHQVSWEVASQ